MREERLRIFINKFNLIFCSLLVKVPHQIGRGCDVCAGYAELSPFLEYFICSTGDLAMVFNS